MKQTLNFLKLQPKQFQDMFNFYKYEVDLGLAPSQISKDLSDEIHTRYGFSEEVSQQIATKLYNTLSNPNLSSCFVETTDASSKPHAIITTNDYNNLVSQLKEHQEDNEKVITLLLSFLIMYRNAYHPSGWIRYDKKSILYLSGLSKTPVSKQEQLTTYLHSVYQLQMRVVGCNNPITCFGFPWLTTTDEDQQIDLGELSPTTVSNTVSQIMLNISKEAHKNA